MSEREDAIRKIEALYDADDTTPPEYAKPPVFWWGQHCGEVRRYGISIGNSFIGVTEPVPLIDQFIAAKRKRYGLDTKD